MAESFIQLDNAGLLGRLGAQMEMLSKQVEEISKKLESINTQLTQQEAHNYNAQIQELRVKVAELENSQIQRQGIAKAIEWIPKYAGWWFAALFALFNGYTIIKG